MTKDTHREAFEEAFSKKKERPAIDSLGTSLALVGLSAGIGSMLIGGMNKMFGEQEKIPKGVVKEMTHGIMLGVQDMIAEKEYDIKDLKEKLERSENDLREVKEERDATQRRYDELMNFAEEMKTREKAKKPYTGKKRGPKPGSKNKKRK